MSSKNSLGKWTATSLVLGNMIGSGVFLLPASLAYYGGISIVGWLVSALGAIIMAQIFSKLGRAFPKTGGPYTFTQIGFGDFAAFLVTWGYWISIMCTNAAITVAMLSYLGVFIPGLSDNPFLSIALGLSTIWFLTWINTKGMFAAGWIQLVTTIIKITPLFLISIAGLFFLHMDHFVPFNAADVSPLQAILATATLTLFAFLGIESATVPAENVEDASSNIPKATIYGTYIAIFIYVLGSIAVLGVLPREVAMASEAPFADAAALIWNDSARKWVAFGAVVSTFGALNGWILIQGQVPLAAARDQLFPSHFAKLNIHESPAIGIVLSSIIVTILYLMNYSKGMIKAFEFMILLATLTCLVPYLFSSATYIYLSLQKHHSFRFSGWIFGSIGFIFSLLAVIGSGQEVVFWGFILLMLGLPVYVWFKKN